MPILCVVDVLGCTSVALMERYLVISGVVLLEWQEVALFAAGTRLS